MMKSILLISSLCLFLCAVQTKGECSKAEVSGNVAVICPPSSECMERINDTLRPLSTPLQNQYQCYNTCISSEGDEINPPLCTATATTINPQYTLLASGPFHLDQYSIHKVISPSAQSGLYPNSHHCKYHVACSEPDSYMSVTLLNLDLEPTSTQCDSEPACLDYLQLHYPTGSRCTLCGSELVCRETGRRVNPLLVFNGLPGLSVEFYSNGIVGGCGYNLLATCTRRTFVEMLHCRVPEALIPPTSPLPFPPEFSKRDIQYNSSDAEISRLRRSAIVVPRTASVKYEDGEVSVWVGHVRVKRFPGVFVLQVYNEVEGALTFYGSSNGRSFLGFGVLGIGLGIVQYNQESAPSQLKPNEAERRLIQLLHLGVIATYDTNLTMQQCSNSSKLTQEQRREMEQVALEYDRACNGFLRAAACAYQQLNMARVSIDCLIGVPFPATPRPPIPFRPLEPHAHNPRGPPYLPDPSIPTEQ